MCFRYQPHFHQIKKKLNPDYFKEIRICACKNAQGQAQCIIHRKDQMSITVSVLSDIVEEYVEVVEE